MLKFFELHKIPIAIALAALYILLIAISLFTSSNYDFRFLSLFPLIAASQVITIGDRHNNIAKPISLLIMAVAIVTLLSVLVVSGN